MMIWSAAGQSSSAYRASVRLLHIQYWPTCLNSEQWKKSGGLAPVTRQSGIWRGKSLIQGGRATLRQALYMPALVALRFNPDLKRVYDRLIAKGKYAKVAITAISSSSPMRCSVKIASGCQKPLDHNGYSLDDLVSLDDCRCRRGAPVMNLAHSASFHSSEKNAPSNPGTKQLKLPQT